MYENNQTAKVELFPTRMYFYIKELQITWHSFYLGAPADIMHKWCCRRLPTSTEKAGHAYPLGQMLAVEDLDMVNNNRTYKNPG